MMNDGIKKIEDFFKYDLKVKELLNDVIPKQIDFYDNESKVKYADKVLGSLKKIELFMNKMFLSYEMPKYMLMQFVNKMDELNDYVSSKNFYKLLNDGYDDTLKYIHNNIGNMRVEFVDSVQKSLIGYYGFFGEEVIKPITINEFLHYVHSYVINNENFYSKIEMVRTTKEDEKDWKGINLRGVSNDLGNKLFEEIVASNMDSDCIDIINLDKNILIMARDLGHAAVIEVELEKEDAFVKYHFPKNNNKEMTSKLKGINVNRDEFAIGNFQTTKENIVEDLCSLMKGIPTDMDRVDIGFHF